MSETKMQNDIHGLSSLDPAQISTRVKDRSYTVRELVKALLDTDDLEALVCVRFRNCDPIQVSDIEIAEGQINLDASI